MATPQEFAEQLRGRAGVYINRMLNQGAQLLAGEIKRVTPVDTGFLRNHIFGKREGAQIVAYTNVPYAAIPQGRRLHRRGRRRPLIPRPALRATPPIPIARQPYYWRRGVARGVQVFTQNNRRLITEFENEVNRAG